MRSPLVSVIITTYNRANLVPRAIKSVLGQTYDDLEVIVVDDASADDTGSVINNFEDERLAYVRHDENRHLSAARNTGINRADGDYVAFLDDDDEWRPRKLEKQVSLLESASNRVGLVYCWMDYCDDDTVVEKYQPSLSGDIFAEALSGQPIGSGSTLVVRPAVFNDIGGFDESLRRGIDGDFIRRVCRSYDVDFVPEALVKYHIGHEADRITSIDPESTEDAIQANEAKLRKFATEFERYPSAKGAVYARLGLRHCLLGDYRTGISYHLKAIRQAPLNPAVYKHQAVTLYRLLNMKL